MKKIIYFITFCFCLIINTNAFAQQTCCWEVFNSCDCSIYIQVKIVCGEDIETGPMHYVDNGSWESPVNTVIDGQPCCDPECDIFIIITTPTNSYTLSNGQYFCCQGPIDSCITNDCNDVFINCLSRKIYIQKPSRCQTR